MSLSSVLATSLGMTAAADAATLRVYATGVGASVQISPTGQRLSCNYFYCLYRFPAGSTVRVAATSSDPAGTFVGWLGACSGATSPCDVVMDADKRVYARFTPVRMFFGRRSGGGDVTLAPAGASCGRGCQLHPYNTALTLTATAAAGWVFSRWHGVCATLTTANVCTPTLVADADALPEFDCAPDYRLPPGGFARLPWVRTTIAITGPGYVTYNGHQCRVRCSFAYRRGHELSLRAYPLNSPLAGWSGRGCSGAALRCQLSAIRSVAGPPPAVIARFE